MATPEELKAAEAAEAEKRRIAEEARILSIYQTLGNDSHLGGGVWGTGGPNQFQDAYLARTLPGYSFYDETPDEGGGSFWHGPDYEQFPSSTSDSFDPREAIQERTDASVRAALQGATPEDVEGYWEQQRMQAAVNAYNAPWLGPQFVDLAVEGMDLDRQLMELPRGGPEWRAAAQRRAEVHAAMPASPKGSMWDVTWGGIKNILTNPVIMAALTAGLATPAVAGGAAAMTPVQAATATGALSGAASNENPFVGALRGGAIGGLTAGAGQYAGEATAGLFPDNPWVSGLARGAATGITGAALTGGDIFQSGAIGGVMGGLSGYGQPSQADVDFDTLMADAGADLDAMQVQPTTQQGMLPVSEIGPLADPAGVAQFMAGIPEAEPGTTMTIGGQQLDITDPATIEAARASGNLIEPFTAPSTLLPPVSEEDMEAAATEEALTGEPAPTEETPQETSAKDAIKAAKKIYELMQKMGFGQDVPEFALPPREADESDEEYLTEISDLALGYLGLDADAMKDAGYEPGTQGYMDYILAQADKVIAAAFGDADPSEMEGKSIEELQAEFKGKSEKEMEELTRALYVRGALGTMSFKESQIDPFTGELEYLGADGATAPTAGAQRGYARFLEETAGLSAPEARRALKGLLGRDIDIFDLGKAKKERKLQDMLAEFNTYSGEDDEEDDLYERRGGSRRGTRGRGMLPTASRFWRGF